MPRVAEPLAAARAAYFGGQQCAGGAAGGRRGGGGGDCRPGRCRALFSAELASNIEDEPNNTTRFVVLGRQEAGPSGRDKTSLIMSAHNQTGALSKLLAPFSDAGVSMTRLESRPARHTLWEYVFFVDIEGHRDDAPVGRRLPNSPACALPEAAGLLPDGRLLSGPGFFEDRRWQLTSNRCRTSAISPYQPGKPITQLAREMGLAVEQIVKLASNENPLGMSPKAQVAVAAAIAGLARYPDDFA
jgi:hypothetical protein